MFCEVKRETNAVHYDNSLRTIWLMVENNTLLSCSSNMNAGVWIVNVDSMDMTTGRRSISFGVETITYQHLCTIVCIAYLLYMRYGRMGMHVCL